MAGKYLRSLGIAPHEDVEEEIKTFTFRQSAQYFREKYGVRLSTAEIIDGMNKIIGEHYKYDIPLKPGVEDLLKRLSDRGIKMCVATASERVHAVSALTRLGVIDYFSRIFVCSELNCDKTEPAVYRAALSYFGTERKETAVFEDTLHALLTAKKDGFVTVAVFDGCESDQVGMKEAADYYAADLSSFEF